MTSHDLAPDAPLDQVEWRVQGKIDRGGGVQVVAYLDAPTISRLLDEWVGPDRWRDHYEPTGKQGTMWCHLSIRFGDEWVTKEDLGTASDMEADKGLVSDAFKRVAMRKWGVGRNVFDLPVLRITQFRQVERQGKDPMAYLTDQSHAQIRQLLKGAGFEEAAEQTRVSGAMTTETRGDDDVPEVNIEPLEAVIAEAVEVGVQGDFDAMRAYAAQDEVNVGKAVLKLRAAIREKKKAKAGEEPADESSGTQTGAPAAGTESGERDASPSPAADDGDSDTTPSSPEGTAASSGEPPTWQQQAEAEGITPQQLLIGLQKAWPANDVAAKPTRTSGLDSVADRHEGLYASVIERLAQEQRQQAVTA